MNKKKTPNIECKLATACSNTLSLWWKSEIQIEDGPWEHICETLETCGSRESSLVYAIVLQPSPLAKHNVPLQHINCWVQLKPLLLWNIIRRGLAHAVGWRSRRVSTEHWAAHIRILKNAIDISISHFVLYEACLTWTTSFPYPPVPPPSPWLVGHKQKTLVKADPEQWALSLGLQGNAFGQFNDAGMYLQPR